MIIFFLLFHPFRDSIFISEAEKNILLRIAGTTMVHCPIFNFDFDLFLKNISKIFSKKPTKIFK